MTDASKLVCTWTSKIGKAIAPHTHPPLQKKRPKGDYSAYFRGPGRFSNSGCWPQLCCKSSFHRKRSLLLEERRIWSAAKLEQQLVQTERSQKRLLLAVLRLQCNPDSEVSELYARSTCNPNHLQFYGLHLLIRGYLRILNCS